MRLKPLFLCLLLLVFVAACGNKSADQSASTGNTAASNTTADNQSASAPASGTSMANSNAASSEEPRDRSGENESASAIREREPAPLVIPAGTAITVRLQNSVSSATAQSGDTFTATVSQPITVDGQEVVPAGAAARGTIVEAQAKGKIKGEARLRLELTELTIHGKSYRVQTTMAGFTEKGKGKRTAVTTGGGAALGALIGGLAGGGKGAAIGVLAGGGAGFAGGAFTGNKQIVLPAESALAFKLKDSVTLK